MTLKNEIVRGFFVAFGMTQTVLNFNYLLREDGLESARKQHKELPSNITDKQIKTKVSCMLLFGILIIGTGLFSYFTRSYYKMSFVIVVGLYLLYALAEALYYRYWRTCGAFLLVAVIFFIVLF